MSWETWWLFLITVFLLSATPGPNMLHIMSRSLGLGLRRSIPAMAGCLSAVLLILAASAAGLGALLLASPMLFEVLRYAGVLYLLWLGWQLWKSSGADLPQEAQFTAQYSAVKVFRGGFLVGISNPKSLLFATAFLPQFIAQDAPKLPQFALLMLTFAACELVWYGVYALCGRQLRGLLAAPRWRKLFDRLTGVAFVGFAAALLRFRGQ